MEITAVCLVVDAEGGVEQLPDEDFGPYVPVKEAVEVCVSYVLICSIQMALLLINTLLINLWVIMELIDVKFIEILQQLVVALLRNNLKVIFKFR